jgi:hypothetical protein
LLSAQVVVLVFAKIADAYKLDKETHRRFSKHGAIGYDSRILTYEQEVVSHWTGTIEVGYSAGGRQKELLKSQQGESAAIVLISKSTPRKSSTGSGAGSGTSQVAAR